MKKQTRLITNVLVLLMIAGMKTITASGSNGAAFVTGGRSEGSREIELMAGTYTDDAGDSKSNAMNISEKLSCVGTVDTDADTSDWYKFEVDVTGNYRVIVKNISIPEPVDIYLTNNKGLVDNKSSCIAEYSGCAQDKYFCATSYLQKGKVYYICIQNSHSASSGEYKIVIRDR